MKLIKPSHEILNISENPLRDIERSARTCYKSEDKMKSGSDKELVKKLVNRGHYAMLEFADMTVRFVCDRGVSHELVRHRLCSFAQESTRYCDYSKDKHNQQITFIIPQWFDLQEGEYKHTHISEIWCNNEMLDYDSLSEANKQWLHHMEECEDVYMELLDEGQSPQQARLVLPHSLKTEIVVKANFREWMHIFNLRTSEAAHPQMVEIMKPLHEKMKKVCPEIFKP